MSHCLSATMVNMPVAPFTSSRHPFVSVAYIISSVITSRNHLPRITCIITWSLHGMHSHIWISHCYIFSISWNLKSRHWCFVPVAINIKVTCFCFMISWPECPRHIIVVNIWRFWTYCRDSGLTRDMFLHCRPLSFCWNFHVSFSSHNRGPAC